MNIGGGGSSNLIRLIFAFVTIIGCLVLALVLPITLGKQTTPWAPLMFEAPTDFSCALQQHLCPCKNDWLFATNERLISNANFDQGANDVPDPRGLSAMIPFWGQFIDHDIVLSQSDPLLGAFSIQMVPYNAFINTTRNAFQLNTTTGCRQAVTLNTPMIDASTIYGDFYNPLIASALRGNRCQINMSAGNLLPLNPVLSHEFLSGDPRNSEHSVLTSLHTLWTREHNRLCVDLHTRFPSWTEDQRFWKARQIVIAKI